MDQPTQKDQIQLSLATQILQPRAPATPLVTNKVTLWPVKPTMVFRAPPYLPCRHTLSLSAAQEKYLGKTWELLQSWRRKREKVIEVVRDLCKSLHLPPALFQNNSRTAVCCDFCDTLDCHTSRLAPGWQCDKSWLLWLRLMYQLRRKIMRGSSDVGPPTPN